MQSFETFYADATNAIIGAILAVIAWFAKQTWGRLRRLENCAAKKSDLQKLEENTVRKEHFDELRNVVKENHNQSVSIGRFEAFAERAETDRRELREGVIGLYRLIDEIRAILIRNNTDG